MVVAMCCLCKLSNRVFVTSRGHANPLIVPMSFHKGAFDLQISIIHGFQNWKDAPLPIKLHVI